MKKNVLSMTIVLLLICSIFTAYADVTLNPDYIFDDGEYIYTFGNFDTQDSPDEVGVTINDKYYNVKDEEFTKAISSGKFGIGLSDPSNLLGLNYSLTPYTKKQGIENRGNAITVEKNPIRNLQYIGPQNASFDGTPLLHDNFATGVQLYNNYANILSANILPSLRYNPYITIPNPIAGTVPTDIKNAWGGNTVYDWISFDLYKSATIRVISGGNIDPLTYPKYGFTVNTTSENNGYYFSRLNSDWPAAEQAIMDRMYTKHIELSGNEYTTVVLPNAAYHGTNKWGYVVIIEFDDKEIITPEITNLTYAGPTDPDYTYNVQKNDNFQNGSLLYCNYSNFVAANLDSAFAGKPYIIMDNPIAGSMPSIIKNAWGNGIISWITFEINKTATVRIFTDGDSLAYGNGGYTKNLASTYYFQKLNTNDNTPTNITIMYTKTFEVIPGQKATVSIPNTAYFGTSKWGHIVVVDFEE